MLGGMSNGNSPVVGGDEEPLKPVAKGSRFRAGDEFKGTGTNRSEEKEEEEKEEEEEGGIGSWEQGLEGQDVTDVERWGWGGGRG
eukprot:628650-Hanusia_phi.AAC.4